MTEKPPLPRFILDEAQKWITRVIFAAVAMSLVYLLSPLRDRLTLIWHGPDRLAEISEKLDQLSQDVMRATGEDRVIHEVAGLSYVREPVYQGDPITLSLVVRRTRTGAACTLISRTAIFTDEANIASAGPAKKPARQVGTNETPLRLRMDVPPQVAPGRVTVYLSLEFDCAGRAVYDATRPVAFMLLKRPE